MEDLEQILLEVMTERTSWKRDELQVRFMKALGRRLQENEFPDTVQSLETQHLVSVRGEDVRRSELDFPERLLEQPIEDFLASEEVFRRLRLHPDMTVWQRTARGGRAGTGIWSRPDFTIATIRRRKYDPVRHLDLMAFELKNLAGSTVVAVHEALAHTRFAHYAFLLCPRSALNEGVQTAIRESCALHGVGLISFEIQSGASDKPKLDDFRFEVDARRQSPEPDQVDSYIDDRFDEESCKRLLKIAGG